MKYKKYNIYKLFQQVAKDTIKNTKTNKKKKKKL